MGDSEFVGSALYAEWVTASGTTVLSTDARNFNYRPSLAFIDASAGADSNPRRLAHLKDGQASITMLTQSDMGTADMANLEEGMSGTLYWGEYGGTVSRGIPAISMGASYTIPYNNVGILDVTFQQNGERNEDFYYDNFGRANGAPGTALTGQVYGVVPAGLEPSIVEASISSYLLVAADSGTATTAAYTGIDIGDGRTPKRMSAKIIFSAGGINGQVVLVSNPLGLTYNSQITAGSLHIVFTSNYCDIGVWDTATYTIVQTYVYPTACTLDGATQYSVAWSIDGNTVTIEAPDGTTYSDTNASYSAHLGRYCTFEHYWASGQCQPSFLECLVVKQ